MNELDEINKSIKERLLNEDAAIIEGSIYGIDTNSSSDADKKKLFNKLLSLIHEEYFEKFSPAKADSYKPFKEETRESNIINNTYNCYNIQESAFNKKIVSSEEANKLFTKENHFKLLRLIEDSNFAINKQGLSDLLLLDIFIKEKRKENISSSYFGVGSDRINAGGEECSFMENIKKAISNIQKDGEVVSVLSSEHKADMIRILDKYSIRLGDGKHYVASADIKVSFRDPSEKPSWATWFMEAVPLADIPDRAELLLLSEEDRADKFPKELEDNPIICHASLWKLGQATGVLLHTSWCHISATYRWKIDKPFEIASLLFKAVSHPAHIARNFGYAPQLTVPGSDWF